MEFNSIPFLALFALTALLSYSLGEKFRVAMLLLASTLFYCFWRVDHGILVAALIFVDFIAARRMGNLATGRKRNIWFSLGITANLGSLFLFKYSTLLAGPLRLLTGSRASSGEPFLELAAPVGISYFVLKKMAYLIDVHRGALVPERKFHHYALYVAFFPVALAGPLDLPAPLLSQFARPAPFDYSRVSGGLKLMAWGLFKKLVVADRLAVFVGAVFDHPAQATGGRALAAIVLFTVQLYADFSGYTDLAIGSAQVLGITVADNFNRPFTARSLGEFWQRWHISLSTWLRHYLFLPVSYAVLRISKKEKWGPFQATAWAYGAAVMLTMTVCGLWHGPRWTFVLWGALHGFFLLLSFATRRWRKRMRKRIFGQRQAMIAFMQRLLTFGLFTGLFVFFRSRTLEQAFTLFGRLGSGWSQDMSLIWPALKAGWSDQEMTIALSAVAAIIVFHFLVRHDRMRGMLEGTGWAWRWLFYVALVLSILNLGWVDPVPFIYSQF